MVASDPQIAVGAMVLGEVLIEQELCVGGLGALYRGAVRDTGPVFVRAMRSGALAFARDFFPREVSVVRHAEHSGIVSPTFAAIEGDLAIVAYEPTPGTPLCTTLRELGTATMTLAKVGQLVSELAEILDHAHRQPVRLVHGALSPSSVVLTGNKRTARLLDLGIVQALEQADVFGRARWDVIDPGAAAPEVVTRTFPIDEATDVFGLASIAFACLTGRPPFPARSPTEAKTMIASGKRPSAQALRRELSADVDRVLDAAWSVDPRGRPQEVQAFADAFAVALARSAARATGSVAPGRSGHAEGTSTATPLPEAALIEEEPTAIRNVPANVRRAMTLPFGIKTNPPRSEPPPGPATVPRMVNAEALDVELRSDPPPAPPPEREVAAEAAPAREVTSAAPQRGVVAAAPAVATPPGPPSAREEREPLRVVSVTALVVSLVIGGAIIAAGALVGGSMLVARRIADGGDGSAAIAPATPASAGPTVAKSAVEAAEPSDEAPAKVGEASHDAGPASAATASAAMASTATASAATPASTLWPDMPKEPGPRPNPKALETLRERLKIGFDPCVKMTPKPPPGMPWMLHLELDGPTGRPILVEVSKPYKGTVAGACILRAALDARVPPFDSARWAIDLKFGPT